MEVGPRPSPRARAGQHRRRGAGIRGSETDVHFGGGKAIGWIAWVLILVLFGGLVIAAIVLAIRWLIRADRRGSHEGPATPDALEILRQRYARGEIDEAEYERRRAVLKG